jgi:EAL domain-containing protein (putative c-di-GMP-specific phosphodiesterase class I)
MNYKDKLFGIYHDYFYILDFSESCYTDIIEKGKALISRISKTMQILEYEVQLYANVGIVRKSDSLDDKNLLNLVDITLLEIQKNKGLEVKRYNNSLQDIIHNRLQMEVSLKKALRNKLFDLYLQPQVDSISERVVSAEALIRWKSDDGYISPNIFIPIAEEMGLMEELGIWIIDEAVRHVKRIKDLGYCCPIAINISVKQMNERLVDKFTQLLETDQISAKDVSIEITETKLMEYIETQSIILNRISKLGIHIALDDFGTGYSSMNYLQKLHFDKLKIDKHFIDFLNDPKQKGLVKSMILMGHEMGYETIVEGVETVDQFEVLKSMDVNIIQGWYFSKALPVDRFIDYLQSI